MRTCEKVLGTVDQLLIECNHERSKRPSSHGPSLLDAESIWMNGSREKSLECNQRSHEEMENTPRGQKWEQIIKEPMDRH